MKPYILCFCLVVCARAATPPSIANASPNVIDAGGSYFPMTINGTGFVSGAVASWGPIRLNTTFVTATQITAEITPDLRILSGKFNLTVANPGGLLSNAYPITVAPGLSTIAPAAVVAGSPATTITVKGFGFTSGEVLVLNADARQSPLTTTYVDSGTLTATIPAGAISAARTATVQILDPSNGNSSGALPFDIRAAPAIASVSPNPVDAGGSYFQLTVTGTGFTSTSIVNWPSGPLTTTFVSATRLQAAIGPEQRSVSGTFNLTVSESRASSAPFPMVISPVLFAISPASAAIGGPAVTLTATGAGFTRNNALTLIVSGRQSQLATTFVNATTLTASIPPAALSAAGSAAIQVVDSAGAGHSLPQPFTIAPPVAIITGLIPDTAAAGAASFFVTLNGAGFAPGATVLWNGKPLPTAFQNPTQLSAFVTSSLIQIAGTAAITASNSAGAASNSLNFTIHPPPPTISALIPPSAMAGVAFILTVNGANCAGSIVQWNGLPLVTTQVSATQVTASVPSTVDVTVGTAAVRLVDPYGAASSAVQFTLNPPASTLTSLSPNGGTAGVAAFTLTVSGANFVAGAVVLWNGLPLSTSFVTASQLTASVPPGVTSSVLAAVVTVASPGGAVSNALSFTIDPPQPGIGVLSPPSATAGDPSFTVAVTGVNFAIGCVLQWNGLPLSTTFLSVTRVAAVVPAALVAAAGSAAVTVINPSGLISPAASFTISPPAPLITTVSPGSAVMGGPPLTITVSGVGFVPGAAVLWNAIPLPSVAVSWSQLTAVAPANLIAGAGIVTIAVAIPGAISNPLSFIVSAPLPTTSTAGIVNTASYLPSIAPGSLISILGANLAPGDATAVDLPLPAVLNGTSVTVNGVPAPLFFVSSTVINAQAPFETQPGNATLLIQTGTLTSAPVIFAVTAAAPGVLTAPGGSHATARNNPSGDMNSADNPARPGDSVTVYVTGQGLLDNPIATGLPAPPTPLSVPLAPVSAQVGGQDAVITFTGMATGVVGLLQIDLLIPDVAGGEQPLALSIGGVVANVALLSVTTDRVAEVNP